MNQTIAGATRSAAVSGKWLVLLTCAMGLFVGNMASFPVAVIMPTIAKAFQVELPTAQWAVTGHFVALAATMLPVGSAGDILGRKRVFIAGLLVLLVSLAVTPFAGSIEPFVALRVVQGVGAGMVMVTTPALISAAFPAEERGRALGLTFLGGYLSVGLGQPAFGVLAELAPWYTPFLLILAPALVTLGLGLKLPSVARKSGRPFDPMGALLLMVGCGGIVVAAGHGQEEGWELQHTLAHVGPLAAVSIGALVAYGFHAKWSAHPILPLGLFKNPTLINGAITNSLAHMTMLMVSFLMPFYLQNALGYSPLGVALFMVPMSLALNVMAVPSGWMYDRWGSRLPCSIAMCLGAVLLFSYQGLSADSTMLDVALRMVAAGVVLGLFSTPNVSAILGAVPAEHYSLASGFEQTTRNMGHAIGAVVASGVASVLLGSAAATATPETYVQVVHGAGMIAAVLMTMGAVLVLFRQETVRPRAIAPVTQPLVTEIAPQGG